MRIAVAMSGGVDSSVAALLLQREGHEVIGLSMQLWDRSAESGRTSRCCAAEDFDDARRVAWALGIPHYVLDLEEEFAEKVVRPFVSAYLAGETPVPCSACNSHVKFATLWDRAREIGCSAVATGHYVRRGVDGAGVPVLRKGLDPAKDQSYFLWDLTAEQLAAARFPVGELTKGEVRALAREASLPTADKEESQEICFVPKGERAGDFVRSQAMRMGMALPSLSGTVETSSGERVGTHEGHFRFTVGQRRGIGVAGSERLYVLSVDAPGNRVVVGGAAELETREARVEGLRFLSGPRRGEFRAGARVRHRAPEVAATVWPEGDGSARILFDQPVRAVAPGQSCVFYEGDVVIGGGVIKRPHPAYAGAGPAGDETRTG